MKLRLGLVALSLCAVASAQSITNGSFEYDNDPSNGNHNLWHGESPAVISATGSPSAYLPGWTITRSTTWGSSQDRVDVFNSNSSLYPGNPYGGVAGDPVKNGPHTGLAPFNAQDGQLYLGIYNNEAPSDLTTSTTVATSISALTVGQSYRVDYWFAAIGYTNNGLYNVDLQVNLDGAQKAYYDILSFDGQPTATGGSTGIWETNNGAYNETVYTNWQKGSFTFQATSASAALSFIGLLQGGPALLQLDNVSVTMVPEPSSLLIAAMGMTGLMLRRRR